MGGGSGRTTRLGEYAEGMTGTPYPPGTTWATPPIAMTITLMNMCRSYRHYAHVPDRGRTASLTWENPARNWERTQVRRGTELAPPSLPPRPAAIWIIHTR